MKIVDLNKKNEALYFVCLEDWSDDMKEAADHKAKWYKEMKNKGLRVKLAQSADGIIAGMIQYVPIEYSFAKGEYLYIILCIWVHGHKRGIGDYRKRGIGKALLSAAEDDVKKIGAKGLVAWGLMIPAFIKASWYKKQGYEIVDKDGITALLWKPFLESAVKPTIIKQKKKPERIQGQVTVYAFKNGWCPVFNLAYERAKKSCASFQEKVVFREFDTTKKEVFEEWGIRDGLFVDDKLLRTGPPPSYEKIYGIIEKRVKKIKG